MHVIGATTQFGNVQENETPAAAKQTQRLRKSPTTSPNLTPDKHRGRKGTFSKLQVFQPSPKAAFW
jgi:hypothetical protein